MPRGGEALHQDAHKADSSQLIRLGGEEGDPEEALSVAAGGSSSEGKKRDRVQALIVPAKKPLFPLNIHKEI